MTPLAPDLDRSVGLLVYSTAGERHEGRLRTSPGAFRVEEVFDLGDLRSERARGYVPVYRLTKSGIDTPHAANLLSERLKSQVKFVGMKDSHATTVQYVSAMSSRAEAPQKVSAGRFEAELLGFSERPLSRGMMAGNRFTIEVATKEDLAEQAEGVFAACERRTVANFFGYQRFGLRGQANHRVGRAIVARDFQAATELVLGGEASETGRLAAEGRHAEALLLLARGQDVEQRVARHLADRPGDYLGALRRVPIQVRRLYVHAFQAYVFNAALSRALGAGEDIYRARGGDNWTQVGPDGLRVTKVHGVKEPPAGDCVPLLQLVGYAYRDYGSRFDRVTNGVLEEQGIKPAQFYIKEADEMSSEGGFRHAPLLLRGASQEAASGSHIVRFTLGRGEYATVVLREVLKPSDPLACGF